MRAMVSFSQQRGNIEYPDRIFRLRASPAAKQYFAGFDARRCRQFLETMFQRLRFPVVGCGIEPADHIFKEAIFLFVPFGFDRASRS